jgi:hypothetical protein
MEPDEGARGDLLEALALRYVLGLQTRAVRRRYEQLRRAWPELEHRTREMESRVAQWLQDLNPYWASTDLWLRVRFTRLRHSGPPH